MSSRHKDRHRKLSYSRSPDPVRRKEKKSDGARDRSVSTERSRNKHKSKHSSSRHENKYEEEVRRKHHKQCKEREGKSYSTKRKSNSDDETGRIDEKLDKKYDGRLLKREKSEHTLDSEYGNKGEKNKSIKEYSDGSESERHRKHAKKSKKGHEDLSVGSRVKKRKVDSDDNDNRNEKSSRYWELKESSHSEEDDISRISSRENRTVIGSRYYEKWHSNEKRVGKPMKKEQSGSKEVDSSTSKIEKLPAKKSLDPISSKTGGAYIPPAMLKLMQDSITDKSSAEYQRISWEALKKSIHGLINKVNKSNIDKIIRQLLKENIVRGRGLLVRSIIQAQTMSPTFTPVYAALAALINSRFPNIGELLLKRLVLQFKRGFKRNDKVNCISSATFIAHLVNQRVAHEILALEILTLLVETPTDDSIEVAIAFLKECGMKLSEVSKKGIEAIFEMLRHVLSEGKVDQRVAYMVEVMYQVRKDKFKDNEAIAEGLDLVEEEDQFTHLITLEDVTDGEDILNVFKVDTEYLEHEEKYKELSREMVGESDDSDGEEDGSGEDDDDDEEENEDDEESEAKKQVIVDNTETNAVALRRTIYLIIYSSLDFQECAHKLMRLELKPGQEQEVCAMILDCCCEMRTYERFYGLLAQRLCEVNRTFIPPLESLFKDTYDTVHRLKSNQLRNVAKLFAHLLFTDAISWDVLSCIRLNEEDTTSSGRIFIKFLFHELSEYMGLGKLNERVKDATLQDAFSGLFPRDNPRHTRFSINFFTSIGLGGLTDELREHLKVAIQTESALLPEVATQSSLSSSSSDDDSSDDSGSSDTSNTDSSEDEKRKKAKKHGSKEKKHRKYDSSSSDDAQNSKKKTEKKKKPSSKRTSRYK